ncbi:MAG: hypothetical protein AB7O67_21800 [Vicinamibacterales bacterium]
MQRVRALAGLIVLAALSSAVFASTGPVRAAGVPQDLQEPGRWDRAHGPLPGQALVTERSGTLSPGCVRSADASVPSGAAAVRPRWSATRVVHVAHSTGHLTASPATSLRGPPLA